MSVTGSPVSAGNRLAATGVRRLKPESTRIFEGTFSLLHCVVEGGAPYRGVFAVRLFPISYPEQFISLRYTDEEDKIQEIGVIGDLQDFPEPVQRLVRTSLSKQYYEQIITRVHEVEYQYGLLFLDVETEQGRRQFVMPWRYDRADDYGANGKVLLDALDNRYIIPDLAALPAKDRLRFTSYIYW